MLYKRPLPRKTKTKQDDSSKYTHVKVKLSIKHNQFRSDDVDYSHIWKPETSFTEARFIPTNQEIKNIKILENRVLPGLAYPYLDSIYLILLIMTSSLKVQSVIPWIHCTRVKRRNQWQDSVSKCPLLCTRTYTYSKIRSKGIRKLKL